MNPDEIRAELNARKGDWKRICAATELGYSWLQKFAQGRISSPGYYRVSALATYLAANHRDPDAAGDDSDPRAVSTRRTHEYDRRHEHGRRQADQGDVEPV